MKKTCTLLLVLCMLPALCACGSGGGTAPAEEPAASAAPVQEAGTPAPAPELTPAPTLEQEEEAAATAEAEAARALFDEGDLYGAYRTAVACRANFPDTQAAGECGALMAEISAVCLEKSPETGTELERTFPYQGGNELRVTAEHGAALVKAVNKKTGEYSLFYVREGETGAVSLTDGTYTVSWKLGRVWFDDTIRFGIFASLGAMEQELSFYNEGQGPDSVRTLTI